MMAISRLPPAAFSLKQFLQRQRVLGIYRNMLRAIRQVPEEGDRKYLRDWARDEFKRNKNATDQDAIRMMITQANNHLEELQKSLALAKS
uniref:LYR motif-containing protein 2 n=1 Tax=Centroberyx gerrardi TaxID=166262 RepID=UPI003AADED5D